MADGSKKKRGGGFKTGFFLGSLAGGALGYFVGNTSEHRSESNLPPTLKRYLKYLQAAIDNAVKEGRAAAEGVRKNQRYKREDLDLDDPLL